VHFGAYTAANCVWLLVADLLLGSVAVGQCHVMWLLVGDEAVTMPGGAYQAAAAAVQLHTPGAPAAAAAAARSRAW
jgi:hypothetical protein